MTFYIRNNMNSFNQYKKNITSQWGEDGIILEIFNRLGTTSKTCIEFGAGPGTDGSNVWNLISNLGWQGLLIDPVASRTDLWKKLVANKNCQVLNQSVEVTGESSIDQILKKIDFPIEIDLLSIDIDSNDYHILKGLASRPRVIIIEYNPTIPPHLEIAQTPEEKDCYGASAKAIVTLAHRKQYRLVAITDTNCFLVREEDFPKLEITEPALEEIFESTHLTYLISSYNGSSFLTTADGQPSYSWFYDVYNLNLTKKIFHSISLGLSSNISYSPTLSKELTPVKVFINKSNSNYSLGRFILKMVGIGLAKIKVLVYRSFLSPIILGLRNLIKKITPKSLVGWTRKKVDVIKWNINGQPVPPPSLIKQKTLKKNGKKYNLRVLVETGTAGGDMIRAMKNNFDQIFSIELSTEFFERAKSNFKKYDHITLIKGNSGEKLAELLPKISEPILFWLDAHYSGEGTAKGDIETPIIKELTTIFSRNNKKDVILIDDARCFDGTHDYPTIPQIEQLIHKNGDVFVLKIENDIIVIAQK